MPLSLCACCLSSVADPLDGALTDIIHGCYESVFRLCNLTGGAVLILSRLTLYFDLDKMVELTYILTTLSKPYFSYCLVCDSFWRPDFYPSEISHNVQTSPRHSLLPLLGGRPIRRSFDWYNTWLLRKCFPILQSYWGGCIDFKSIDPIFWPR